MNDGLFRAMAERELLRIKGKVSTVLPIIVSLGLVGGLDMIRGTRLMDVLFPGMVFLGVIILVMALHEWVTLERRVARMVGRDLQGRK